MPTEGDGSGQRRLYQLSTHARMMRRFLLLLAALTSNALVTAAMPGGFKPADGSTPVHGNIDGTDNAGNTHLEIDIDPSKRITITAVAVFPHGGGSPTLLQRDVDYTVLEDGTLNPVIVFTGVLPPDPDHNVHVDGTVNAPTSSSLTGTWGPPPGG